MTTSPLTRSTRLFIVSLVTCLVVAVWELSPAYGGIYYGHLHNHCSYSDGDLLPQDAYSTAKANGLDFFGLSDHASQLTETEYSDMQEAATAYSDATFTGFYGFEWSHSTYGHVAVINSTELITSSDEATNTFAELCTWLSGQTCIAFLNHPGRQDSTGTEFDHFAGDWVGNFVGIELWNKSDLFSRYYYNSGYDGSGTTETTRSGYYDEALQNGWRIGASGSQDHHGDTWGADPYMMAVIANSNSRSDLLTAIRARHFYSTLDRDLELSFSVAGYAMGSSDVLAGPDTEVEVRAVDGDGEAFSKIEIIQNGNVVYSATPANATAPVVTYLSGYGRRRLYLLQSDPKRWH